MISSTRRLHRNDGRPLAMLSRRRNAVASRVTSSPSTRATPPSGTSRVARIDSSVFLPAPLGPSKPKIIPRSTCSEKPRSAAVSRRRSQLRAAHRTMPRGPVSGRRATRPAAAPRGRRAGGELPVSDDAEVVEANARFYRAFEALDIAEMDRVWAHGEHVKCVHPGWPLLSGWEAVRESWETIFTNTEEMRFTLSNVSAVVGGHQAWVTCTENIL